MLSAAVLALCVIVWPGVAHATWFGMNLQGPEAVPYVIGMALFFALLLLMLHRLLESEKATRYFQRRRRSAPDTETIR